MYIEFGRAIEENLYSSREAIKNQGSVATIPIPERMCKSVRVEMWQWRMLKGLTRVME
jgi:hypothetical protein